MSSQATLTAFHSLETALFAVKGRRAEGVRVWTEAQATIVEINGYVDLYSSIDVREALLNAIDGSSAPHVIVDFQGVNALDSSGVAVLVECLHRSRRAHRRFSLCGLNAAPRRVLELTRLSNVFEVFLDLEAALAA